MSTRDDLATLRRLALAPSDIVSAGDGCRILEGRPSYEGTQAGSGVWALWTGIVVSYCRPFTPGKLQLKDERWQLFPDAQMQELHDGLKVLRSRLFAHNDRRHERVVVVIPPGAFLEKGSVTLKESVFDVAGAVSVRHLCEYQVARMKERADELVEQLSAGHSFAEGEMLTLEKFANYLRRERQT